MAEIRINTTGGLKLYDADNSHYAQIVAGTITSNVDAITLGHNLATFNAAVTATGILKTDDTTEATSTTDGSLQTDGGLSVAKDTVMGDDLKLLSDASVIHFGANSEITLTHSHDAGLNLKHTATADDKPVVLTLQTGETDIAANDVIGTINFQAPDEGTGTDAILVAAGIEAVSEGDFSSSSNATKLSFKTGASEAAAEKMSLSSAGLLTVADDIVFKDGGTIGVSSATDAMTVSSGGIVTFKDDILIKDAGTIGSASDADAIAIAANGVVTFSQAPVFPDGSLNIADIDLDGGTDIGAAIVDADLFLVDDGAGGTMRKTAASRLKTYIGDAILTQVATLNETSATGALTFASCFTSTYRNYFVVFDDISVATNGADVNMLFHYGDSNGNDSTNHNYQNIMRYPGTTDTAGEGNGNDIKFVQAQKAAAGCFIHGVMYVFQPLNTTDGVTAGIIHSNSNTNNSAGAQMTVTSFNMPEAGTNSAYTGFQFAASSGNIEGRITVYGIKNPA